MEITYLFCAKLQTLKAFKIDLIVWKYQTNDISDFDLDLFKIDLIVWKSQIATIPDGYRPVGFKIDLIVWKLILEDIANLALGVFKIDLIVWKCYTEYKKLMNRVAV